MNVVINSESKYLNPNIKLYEKYSEYLGKKLYYYKRPDHWSLRNNIPYTKINSNDISDRDLYNIIVSFVNSDNPNPDLEEIYNGYFSFESVSRNDPNLVKAVRELKPEFPYWKIIEIPDDVEFEIETEDGDTGSLYNGEFVAEKHRVWYWEKFDGK